MITPAAADAHNQFAAAYVHIPFCSAVCPYCDFAVVAGQDELAERYVDAVVREVEMSAEWRPLDAIYVGGGTPSHVSPALLARLVEALDAKHGIEKEAEISLEANPEDFAPDVAAELFAIGFNRVSFGAQSLDGAVLAALGRRHRPDEVASAVARARTAGLENISLDLIYGTPGETGSSWQATLESVGAMAPEHVSCYALTVESGTPLDRAVRDGAPSPDPDVQADRFEVASETLAAFGFDRYEVSNWARTGAECRYTLTVWAQGEYEAYGNGAHGYRLGTRFRNRRSLSAYLDAVESGEMPRAGTDISNAWDHEVERLFIGLRRTVGVARGPGGDALLLSEWGRRLLDAEVIDSSADRLWVRNPLLTDEVIRAVLDLDQPPGWAEAAITDIVS